MDQLKASLHKLIDELNEEQLKELNLFMAALQRGERPFKKLLLYEKIIESLPDATFAIDTTGKVMVWNQAMEEMTGIKKEEILGQGDYVYSLPFFGKRKPLCVDVILGRTAEDKVNGYEKLEKIGKIVTGEGFAPLAYEGRGACYWTLAAPIEDEVGNLLGAVQCIRDVTEKKALEQELKQCGIRDSLTGLYNRTFFEEEIKRLEKSRDYPISILICDLDNLKVANDMFGHAQGDKLLKSAAEILKMSVRQGDIVARIGGDEFALLLPKTSEEVAEKVGRRISDTMTKFNEASPLIPLSLSIGVATAEKPGSSLWEALREADDAMYRNKLVQGTDQRVALVKTLKTALSERDFHDTERMKEMAAKFARALNLPQPDRDKLLLLVEMHDIGKLGIPESLLNKPEPLSPEERKIIERHPEIGYRIALTAGELAAIAPLILQHHERWDGNGYPQGLKGEEIDFLSRMMAIIDSVDAMLADRPYRRPLSLAQVLEELKKGVGTQFDPKLTEVFLKILATDYGFLTFTKGKGNVG